MINYSSWKYLSVLAFAAIFCTGCGEKNTQANSSTELFKSAALSAGETDPKLGKSSPIATTQWLDWLPMQHAGYSRSEGVTMDYGDLPRVQVTYTSDSNPESFFVLDVLDGKGPLVVAVRGMINAKLAKKYEEPLLDGYVKVYQNYGVTAFERHTPEDGKTFLEYAIDDRFYFNYKGENVNPDLFWEFFQLLDPKKLNP